jgi:hypothetical protein
MNHKYKCEQCNTEFDAKLELNSHQKRSAGGKCMIKCDAYGCSKTFFKESEFL